MYWPRGKAWFQSPGQKGPNQSLGLSVPQLKRMNANSKALGQTLHPCLRVFPARLADSQTLGSSWVAEIQVLKPVCAASQGLLQQEHGSEAIMNPDILI